MMAVMAIYSALRAVSSNRRRELLPRRSYADCRGDVGRERVPAPAGAAQAVKAVAPALDQQLA